ncbi:hypothetical protein MCAP1_000492 [Malassezia caprae]|uniref:protein-tyrosine-phosphatase n=1 Tax=Malassezia caprae TaxID=1381934 RepID=A0AAF0IV86_9BASI|nr:hypothetical protein MCAP1_000492 [Malassezia caprae]
MAEAVFAHKVHQHGLEEHFGVIDSCGTADYHEGEEPDMRTVRVCKSNNVPISHLARAIQPEDFHKFDFIFGMDSNNIKNMQRIQPKGSKASDDGATVMDPYYYSSSVNGVYSMVILTSSYSDAFLASLKLGPGAQL